MRASIFVVLLALTVGGEPDLRLGDGGTVEVENELDLSRWPDNLIISARNPAHQITATMYGAPTYESQDYRYMVIHLRHGGTVGVDRETGEVRQCNGSLGEWFTVAADTGLPDCSPEKETK